MSKSVALNMDVVKLNDSEIAQVFCDYVNRMQDKERHTEATCKEVDAFDICCSSEFPDNIRLQNLMFDKMMNTAVEYEESGFIAGFKTAMSLLFIDKQYQPKSRQDNKKNECIRENNLHKIKNRNVDIPSKYIDTIQIGEMFHRSNYKTYAAIKNNILPYLTEDERKDFVEDVVRQPKKKDQIVYKLSFKACKKYLEYTKDKEYFVNIKEGSDKLREKMNEVFCSECIF